ncbi:MAG: N-acetylmuramoyl-L-alanine amidase [Bacteroidales bacterium]|nr:N-acetylmuramoyl-L-alanine amidase [Bacteroidales bacterium]MCL2738793.1 N-acetylmuramoyl-L-alanine amidase [Bacteroidales bacterium]
MKTKIASLIIVLTAVCAVAFSQTFTPPLPPPITELRLVRGQTDTVTAPLHIIVGLAPKGSKVWVNKKEVKVFKTGSWGHESNLRPGNNHFEVESQLNDKKEQLSFTVFYNNRPRVFPPADLIPESVSFFPEGRNIWIMEGEPLQIRVVTKSGAQVSWYDGTPLFELEEASARERGRIGPNRSIYQGLRIINRNDSLSPLSIAAGGDVRVHPVEGTMRVLTPDRPVSVRTRNGAYLNQSWGGDRLGGSKINMLDSGITMQVIGKTDALYKVRLGANHSAYIPQSVVELLPDGHYAPVSVTGSWTVSTSGSFDVISIPLSARHPYTIYQEVEPNRLVVDLYGVVCNSNWITQRLNVKEIKRVDLRQIAPDVLRFAIDLKDKNPWGYTVAYSNNSLQIRIKHKPNLSRVDRGDWSGLTFAVDAGHGGEESRGAVSPAGYIEQYQNLAMSYMLKEMLEKRGAKVVLTRPENKNRDMNERKKVVSDHQADFLISIHCNAGGNPLRVGGTSTYYKHIGYRPLNETILARLLELPIQDFGLIGNFNFSLNAVTECPNVLVETLFMSSLADEELIADLGFQRKMMEKVVLGIDDFLKSAK